MTCRNCISDGAVTLAKKYLEELENNYHAENLAYKLSMQHEPAEMHMHAYVMKERAWCRWKGAQAIIEKLFGGAIL